MPSTVELLIMLSFLRNAQLLLLLLLIVQSSSVWFFRVMYQLS
jgi:hypothetical protein